SQVTRWMAAKAEALGVDIFPGFPVSHLLFDGQGAVAGVGTSDAGISKKGEKKEGLYTPGVDLRARVTLLAEGARGSVTQEAMRKFRLRERGAHPLGAEPQSYALGVKEVWEVPESAHKQGTVIHTVGYPMDSSTYGGGFVYHMADRRVALGLVVALDYENPFLSPHQEFNRWKEHPAIRAHIEGGTCLQYGARVLNEGGFQAIPKLSFPGGALVGCSAGFLNVPKIKGTHTAMLSGMYGGEAAFRALAQEPQASKAGFRDLTSYENAMKASWVWEELHRARNIRPGFRWGLLPGMIHAAIDQYILRGQAWWTLHHRRHDHEATRYARDCTPIAYPKPDGKLTFDVPTSLFRSGTNHEHDQPSHLKLKDPSVPEWHNGPQYAAMESRYCPAGVYEYTQDEHGRTKLQINAQNCLHCKACDIKDPLQNIKWTVPEGGGPMYSLM
ncbi:electron transfer flavo protein-ubiquinone oxidoreductase-domain-containing protein, partial [Dunaliella salina]